MKLETVCGLEEIRVAGTRGIAKVEGSTDLFRRDPSGRHSGSVLRHTNSRRLYENRDELQDDEMVHGAWRQVNASPTGRPNASFLRPFHQHI